MGVYKILHKGDKVMDTLSNQGIKNNNKKNESTRNDKMKLQLPTEDEFIQMIKNDSLNTNIGVIINQKYTVYHKYSRSC